MSPPTPPTPPLPRRPPMDEKRIRQLRTERSSPQAIAQRTLGLLQTVHELIPQAFGPSSSRVHHPFGLDAPGIIRRALEAALSLFDAITVPDAEEQWREGRHACAVLSELCTALPQVRSKELLAAIRAAAEDLSLAEKILRAVFEGRIDAVLHGAEPPSPPHRPGPSLHLLRRVARALSLVLPSRHREDWIEERISDLHYLPFGRRIVYVMQMAGAIPSQARVMRKTDREAA